ncbi:hypothetical protein [Xanthomonas graminis]|uniref:hypothetical protein n=1 Tax=Xanthomonas graminis TaxID=3390026 RepID=UPI001112FF5B|nr:hypothetical protein [Xanthomonas translucens]
MNNLPDMELAMRKTLQTAFFTSALAPAVIVIAAKSLWKIGPTLEAVCWLVAGAVACVLPLLIIKGVAKHAELLTIEVKKVEPLEWPLLAAIVAYIFPLVLKDLSFSQVAMVVLVAASLLSAVDALPFHPVLHFFRYRFYKAEVGSNVTCWLVVRERIIDPSRIKRVREIAPGLIMEDV